MKIRDIKSRRIRRLLAKVLSGKEVQLGNRDAKTILLHLHGPDCYLCLERTDGKNRTVDHVIPKAHGGGNGIENLRICCDGCNDVKGDIPGLTVEEEKRLLAFCQLGIRIDGNFRPRI